MPIQTVTSGDTERVVPEDGISEYQIYAREVAGELYATDAEADAPQGGWRVDEGHTLIVNSARGVGKFLHATNGDADYEVFVNPRQPGLETDTERVERIPGDPNSASIAATVSDDGNFTLDAGSQGTLPVEQQTPVQLEDSSGVNIDPAKEVPNSSGIVGDTITPGAGGATFSAQPVPDGFGVVIQNDPDNTDDVRVQDDGGNDRHKIEPGGSFTAYVSDLSDITITGTANNPAVHATVEAP